MNKETTQTDMKQAQAPDTSRGLDYLIDDVRTKPGICEDAFLGAVVATPDEALGHDILSLAADDPILASLIKQYLNASRQHKGLLKSNGSQDAMVEVAADMVDSAWCALQTRLLELRAAEGQAREERHVAYSLASPKPEQPQAAPSAPEDFVTFLMWLAVMWPDMKAQPALDPRMNFSIAAAGRL
jgi:hypothetical protein